MSAATATTPATGNEASSTFATTSAPGNTTGAPSQSAATDPATSTPTSTSQTHTPAHDPYASQAKKEATIGKIEVALGKTLHASGLVAKGEAHLEHAAIVAEQGTRAPGAHQSAAEVQTEREALVGGVPSMAGGVDAPSNGGVADPVVAGPGGQSGVLMPGFEHSKFTQ